MLDGDSLGYDQGVRAWDVDPRWLLPPSLHEFAPPGHRAHFARDMVRTALDLSSIPDICTEEHGQAPRSHSKHLHDIHETFATRPMTTTDSNDEEVAGIMGWSKDRVSQISKVYVDGSRVVMAIGPRIAANAQAKQAAKQ